MKIYLARHAHAAHNLEGILNSDPNINKLLTNLGVKQSKELAKKLKSEDFEVIYMSEFIRTKQTAEIINKYHNVPLIVEKRLNDNISGFEGQPVDKYLKLFHNSEDKWRKRINDGESYEDVRNRANSFLNELLKSGFKSVLIVTHGSVLEAIYGLLHNQDFDEASIFEVKQGDFVLLKIK